MDDQTNSRVSLAVEVKQREKCTGWVSSLRFLYLWLGVGKEKWWETEYIIYCMCQVLIISINSIEGSLRMPLARSASAADCLVYNLAACFTSFSSAVDGNEPNEK